MFFDQKPTGIEEITLDEFKSLIDSNGKTK